MKLVGDLKEKFEQASTKEEAKKVIEEAGIELTDEELTEVAGGIGISNEFLEELGLPKFH